MMVVVVMVVMIMVVTSYLLSSGQSSRTLLSFELQVLFLCDTFLIFGL